MHLYEDPSRVGKTNEVRSLHLRETRRSGVYSRRIAAGVPGSRKKRREKKWEAQARRIVCSGEIRDRKAREVCSCFCSGRRGALGKKRGVFVQKYLMLKKDESASVYDMRESERERGQAEMKHSSHSFSNLSPWKL